MLGLRFALLQPHQQTWLTDGSLDWLWPRRARGHAIALLGPLVADDRRTAERHPGLKLIIDHFGRPDAAWSNVPELVAAAKHRNVALKATGRRAIRASRILIATSTTHQKLYDASADGCSGEPTSRGCRAREAVRHPVHRATAVADGEGQGADHGARPLQLAGWKLPA